MMDYSERVKVLRGLANGIWKNCEYTWFSGEEKVFADAADAIEELQVQLPKRGEWIWDDKRCIYVCSVCGSPKVRENMDRQIIKEQAYCYSCGAKMEVQE